MTEAESDVTIRPATPEDAENIAAMAKALSLSDGGRASRFSADAFVRDGFGETAAFQAMVAERDSAPAGYAVFYWGYDTDSASRGVYLADLYVGQAHRRCGVGTALVTGVSRHCRENGGRWIFWSVLKRNRAARRFYKQLAPELKDVLVCAAFGASFDRIAGAE